MTMTSDVLTVLAVAAGSISIGYAIGFSAGNKCGRDAQWVEDFLDAQKTERDRRDHAGRFKPKTK